MAAVSVLQFVEDAKEDIKSPSTSVFPSKMAAYKNMVSSLDEVSIIWFFIRPETIQGNKNVVKEPEVRYWEVNYANY